MKKITSLALTFIISIITALTISTNAFASDKQLGDVNSDGIVNCVDATQTLRYYAYCSFNRADLAAEIIEDATLADVDADGIVSVTDASYILAYYATASLGETPSWPNNSSESAEILVGDQYSYVGTGTVEFTAYPSDDAESIKTLAKGERFYISEKIDDNWVKISIPKCPTELYLKISDIATDLQLCYRPAEIEIGTQWTFIGNSWNIRTGSSIESPTTGKYLSYGDVITVLAVSPDNWVEIADGEYVLLDRAQFSLIVEEEI